MGYLVFSWASRASTQYKIGGNALKQTIRNSKRECYFKLCAELMVVNRIGVGSRSTLDTSDLQAIVKVLFSAGRSQSISRLTGQVEENIYPVTKTGRIAAARSLPNKKVPGPDSMPNKAIKALLSRQPKAIANLYNEYLMEETFHERWKRQKTPSPFEARQAGGECL